TVWCARDVDVAHELAGLVGLEPGLAVIEWSEGVAVAAEGKVDALVGGLLEVGEDDGVGGFRGFHPSGQARWGPRGFHPSGQTRRGPRGLGAGEGSEGESGEGSEGF